MGRIRPQNWNLTLADFQLGWAENNREACLNNLGPLSSIGRAFVATPNGNSSLSGKAPGDDLIEFADRFQAVHSFCPEGGRRSEERRVGKECRSRRSAGKDKIKTE